MCLSKMDRRLNIKYIAGSYLFGLLFAGTIIFTLYMAKVDAEQFEFYVILMILSFLLYPFARFLFDSLGGFLLLEKSKYNPAIWRGYAGLCLIIFLLSIPLAPIGFIYVAIDLLTRKLRK